jgi:hydrogenase/urease accessory protein HupE
VAVGFNVGRWPAAARQYPLTDPQTRLAAVTLLIVLNVLDVLTTHRVVVHHGGIEGNPLSSWLIAHNLLGAAKAAMVVAIGLMTVRMRPRRASSLALWLVVGFYTAVVLHNVMQIASVS